MKKIDKLCSELAQTHLFTARNSKYHTCGTTYVDVWYNSDSSLFSIRDSLGNHLGDFNFDKAESVLANLIKAEITKSLNLA
jgi:hypothetical protein